MKHPLGGIRGFKKSVSSNMCKCSRHRLHLERIMFSSSLSQKSDKKIAISNAHVKIIAPVVTSTLIPLGRKLVLGLFIIGSMHTLLKCILIIKYIPYRHSISVLNKPPLSSPLRANAAFENTAEPLFFVSAKLHIHKQRGLVPWGVVY